PADLAPVGRKPGAPALEVKVVLIPVAQFLLGRRRCAGARNVLDVVAVAGDERAHAIRPERRDDARGAAAPVVSDQHGLADIERIHQLPQIVAEGGLLARARGLGRQEARRPEPAQVRGDGATSGIDETRHDRIIDTRAVGPAVHEEDGRAGPWSAVVIDDVQRGRPDACGLRRHGSAPHAAVKSWLRIASFLRATIGCNHPSGCCRLARMTLAEFQRSLAAKSAPRGLAPPLVALWWAQKGDWDKAHKIVM